MKNHASPLIVNVLLLISCALNGRTEYRLPEPVTVNHNNITVGFFPQVELISIVQTIGGYREALGFLMTADTSFYRTEVTERFSGFSSHPAVRMFDRLCMQPGMLNFSAPSNIMLLTDESLHLRTDIEKDEFVISRAGGTDSLLVLLDLLRDFAVSSSFNEFFLERHDFYHALAENTVRSMGPANYIEELESFYGRGQRSYNIVLVPLYGHVGFGNSLLHADQNRDIYNT